MQSMDGFECAGLSKMGVRRRRPIKFSMLRRRSGGCSAIGRRRTCSFETKMVRPVCSDIHCLPFGQAI